MNTQETKTAIKKKARNDGSSSVKISKEVRRELNKILNKINKKSFPQKKN